MARPSFLGRLFAAVALVVFGLCGGASAERGRITGAPLVYLRSGPGPEHRPLGVLSEGAEVEIVEGGDRWVKVRTAAGEEGFVFATFVAAAEEAAAAEPQAAPVLSPPPAAPASPAPGPGSALAEEVARLRAEVEALKVEVSRAAAGPNPSAIEPRAASGADATENGGPAETRTSDLEIIGVSVLSLAVGWVLGVVFARRRSRVQRNRLRF